MTAAAVLAKAGAMLLTNEDARKRVGWVLVAVLSPVILLLVFIFSLASVRRTALLSGRRSAGRCTGGIPDPH